MRIESTSGAQVSILLRTPVYMKLFLRAGHVNQSDRDFPIDRVVAQLRKLYFCFDRGLVVSSQRE